ncbi:MAG TPA: sugar phosphate isomerase/epimerase family protein [Phycisphaerae bacterium]|nr:sugar phosphate isomerase/epimerase family protein [Phycisphaerae bacterium]
MKPSISSWSYRVPFDRGEMDLLGFLDEVHRLGAEGFEIFCRHYRADDAVAHLSEAVAKGEELGLEVSSLIAGNNFAAPTAAARAEQVEGFKRVIENAAAAGIGRINCFTGYHADGGDPILEFHRVVDCYREVCPLAEQAGVLLCVENHSTVASDADGLLAVLRAIGSDAMRTNPDPSNFVRAFQARDEKECEAIYTETAKVAPFAANSHLKVADFTDDGEHAFLDVGRLLEIYRQAGYDGHVVLEVYGPASDPADTCAKGIALLRKHR